MLIRNEETPSKKIPFNAIPSFTTVEKKTCLQSGEGKIATMCAGDLPLPKNASSGEASLFF